MAEVENTQEPEAEVVETDEAEAAEEGFAVSKRAFEPSNMEAANEYINEVVEFASNSEPHIPVTFNFDIENNEVPDGYGIVVAPIQKRVEDEGNVTVGVMIAAVPTLEAVLSHGEKGEAYVRDAVAQSFFAKLGNAVRPRADGGQAAHVPYSIEDFIESRRGSDALKSFATLAPKFVRALKEKGLRHMNASLLRQTLSSKAYAESQFPKIQQPVWEGILSMLINRAETDKLDTSLFKNWLSNRDEVAYQEVTEIDLDSLSIE